MDKGRRFSLTQSRPVRAVVALTLTLAVAATGEVAWATHAKAAHVLITSPSSPGNATTPTWTFISPSGTFECSVDRVPNPPSAWVDCSTGTYTPPTLTPDGDYVLSVREVVGTVPGEVTTSGIYTLDTTATGTVTPTRSPYNDPRPSWTIGVEPGGAASCSLVSPATVPAPTPDPCTTRFTAGADLSDGPHTLYVSFTDGLGNAGTTTSTSVVDLTKPAPPVPTGPPVLSNNAAVAWSWAADLTDTATCTLTGPGTTVTPVTCTTNRSFSTTVADEGVYSLAVVLTDEATNVGAAGTSADFTFDPTPPGAPVFQTGPPATAKDRNPTWTFTVPGTATTCRLSGTSPAVLPGTLPALPPGTPTTTVVVNLGNCQGGTASGTELADASWTLTVTTSDAAGNAVSATSPPYLVDNTGPVAPDVDPPASAGNDTTPRFTWLGEMPSTAVCREVKTTSVGTTRGSWVGCTGRYVDLALTEDGDYQVEAQLTDPLGNVGGVGISEIYRYDRTAPGTPVVTSPPSPSSTLAPAWSFVSPADTSAQCQLLSAGATVRGWASCTSPATISLSGLLDGEYVFEVYLTDSAGNVSPTVSSTPHLLDTRAPDAPAVAGPAGPSNDSTPTFTWVGESGASARCLLAHEGVAQGSASSCTTPYDPSLAVDGRWSLQVFLVDRAGNVGTIPGQSGTYILDTVLPATPSVTAPPSPGRATAPSWSAVVEVGATTECRLTGVSAVVFDWSRCQLPTTTDLSAQPDGSYELAVRATDGADQTGAAGTGSYQLDTGAPSAPVFTSVPASPSRSRSVSFGFSSETASTLTCRLTRGPVVISPDTTCASPLPVSLTGLADGAYTLSVHATDAAGNSGAVQTALYVLDTTAPAAPVLVSGPAATSPDHRPSWTFTAEVGAGVTCRVTGAASGVVIADTPCTSPFDPDLTSAADDTYVLTARATDAAGNTGPALSTGYLLDSSAPTTADVVGPATPGRNQTPTWQVSASEGTVQCRVLKGTVVVRDWTTCGPTFTYNLGGTGDGLYVMAARVVDDAGNFSAEVTSRYLLDTAAPVPAILTTPGSPATDRSPVWTVASPDPGVTAQCQVTGPTASVTRAWAACEVSAAGSPYDLDLTMAQDGFWTLVVRLTDAAGNVGGDARGVYQLDSSAPQSVLIEAPDSPSFLATPAWQLIGDSDSVLECRLTGPGLVAVAFAPCAAVPGIPGAGSFTADLTSRPDGTYTLAIRSRDLAGNLGPETTSGYELDRVDPVEPTVPIAPPSPSEKSAITWIFTVEAGSTGLCTLSSSTEVVEPEQPCASPWATDLALYGDGNYRLSVRAVDKALNHSPAVGAHYELDRTAPDPPAIVSSPGSPAPSLTPIWRLQPSAAGDTLECRLFGIATPLWGPCGDHATFNLAPATSGTYRLQAREIDEAGNVSLPTTSGDYVLDPTAPFAPEVVPPGPQRGNTLRPAFTITRQPGDVTTDHLTCTVGRFDGGTSVAAPCAFGTSIVDLTRTPALKGAGDVVLGVRAVTVLGKISAEATATYSYDDIPPATPSMLALTERADFVPTVQWTFASAANTDTFLCRLTRRGVTAPVSRDACRSPQTVTLKETGEYTLSVWAVDPAGNISGTAASSTYTYLPPVPAVAAPVGPASGADATPTWTFSVPRGYQATCSLSGPGATSLDSRACASGTYTGPLTGLTGGTYSLSIRLTDAFGNPSDLVTRTTYRFTPRAALEGHLGQTGPTGPAPQTPDDRTPGVHPRPVSPPSAAGTPTVGPIAAPPRAIPAVNAAVKPPAKRLAVSPLTVAPALKEVPRLVGEALSGLGRKPTIPLLLLIVVVGFLLLQNQIDRRDPKLAFAPVGAEPELDFGPVLRSGFSVSRNLEGGAPA